MNVRNGHGEEWTLGPAEARGGEGTIYSIVSRPDMVAKIYHQPTAEIESKLSAMVARPPRIVQRLHRSIAVAWPLNVLFDVASDQFAGYVMPRIKASQKIFEYYHAPSRPLSIGAGQILSVTLDLCQSVQSLHEDGIVIGDINESNVLVSGCNASLVDAASFQIRSGSRIFRCLVAAPEFAAPELLGRDRGHANATVEEDLHSLSVLLFLLFMDGNHPFRAHQGAHGKSPLIDRVRRGDWPYAKGHTVRPPHGAPRFDSLPECFRDLFTHAFVVGHRAPSSRPSAKQWKEAIRLVVQSGEFHQVWDDRQRSARRVRQRRAVPASTSAPRWRFPTRSAVATACAACVGIGFLWMSQVQALTNATVRTSHSAEPRSTPPKILTAANDGLPTPEFWKKHRSPMDASVSP